VCLIVWLTVELLTPTGHRSWCPRWHPGHGTCAHTLLQHTTSSSSSSLSFIITDWRQALNNDHYTATWGHQSKHYNRSLQRRSSQPITWLVQFTQQPSQPITWQQPSQPNTWRQPSQPITRRQPSPPITWLILTKLDRTTNDNHTRNLNNQTGKLLTNT